MAPGSAVYTGQLIHEGLSIDVIDYAGDHLDEVVVHDIQTLGRLKHQSSVTWINVTGVHAVSAVQKVCELFDVHPLALEDIVGVGTRAKAEEYPDHVFIVAKMLTLVGTTELPDVLVEHLSIVIGPNYVLTFQERAGDVFEGVRQRLRGGRKRLREGGADYLGYALLDAVVDQAFLVVEGLTDAAERLEDEILRKTHDGHLARIYSLRRELMEAKRQLWPLREAVAGLIRADEVRIKPSTVPFLRDLQDNVLQLMDSVESVRDMLMGMVDLHMTNVSNRMNEVMRVLTVVGTLFIPLTFVVGVYGMNFEYMPELHWRWGYPAVWAVMVLTSVLLAFWFRRRGWM